MVREAMHLNGGPVCYLRMNIGKVLLFQRLLHFEKKPICFQLENDGGKLLGMTRGVEAPTFPQFVQVVKKNCLGDKK